MTTDNDQRWNQLEIADATIRDTKASIRRHDLFSDARSIHLYAKLVAERLRILRESGQGGGENSGRAVLWDTGNELLSNIEAVALRLAQHAIDGATLKKG